MAITINDFKSRVQDVTRPNRFLLVFSPPTGGNNELLSYLVKSANVPGRTIGDLELNWQGMKAKLAGDPTYDQFSVTFLSDYNTNARSAIEEWMRFIANPITNERASQREYKSQAIVKQLGRKGEVIGEWQLFGFYPATMDTMDLSVDNTDQAGEFSVTFNLDYWERLS